MNTLKSAALVIVLAGVLYGVYVTLHQPPPPPPTGKTLDQVELETVPPEVDYGTGGTEKGISSVPGEPGEESPRKLNSKFAHDERHLPDRDSGSPFAPPETIPESLPPGPDAAAGHAHNQPAGLETPLSEGNPRAGEINLTAANFKRDWLTATDHVERGRFREALATLTPYYRSPDLNADQQAQLLEWLDALARASRNFPSSTW